MRIGVVGFSAQGFDVDIARELLTEAMSTVDAYYQDEEKVVVSGYTDFNQRR